MFLYRFCSTLYSRTRRNQYALASRSIEVPDSPRQLCRIHLFLSIRLKVEHLPDSVLEEDLVLVEFYDPATGAYPWQHRDIDLGIRINRNKTQPPTFIPLRNLKSSVIITPLDTRAGGPCLASTSCDTVSVYDDCHILAYVLSLTHAS